MNNKIFGFCAVFAVLLGLTLANNQAKADSFKAVPHSAGTYTQWNPFLYGTSNFSNVKENVCDNDATYNVGYSKGIKDSYTLDLKAVPNNSVINRIDIYSCSALYFATSTTPAYLQGFYFFEGLESGPGAPVKVATSTYRTYLLKSFSGLAAVKNASSTMEIGIIAASSTLVNFLKNSNLNARVYYTPPIPAPPSNLNATSTLASTVDLKWSDNSSNEQGFRIERSASSDGPWTQVSTVSANVTARRLYSQPTGQTLYFRVRAYLGSSNSDYSNISASLVK